MSVEVNESRGDDCSTCVDFAGGTASDFTIAITESSLMPMSALNLGEPVPSMTVPFRIMRSSNVISPRGYKCSNFPELDEHTFVTGVT